MMTEKNEEKVVTKKDLVDFQDRIVWQFKIVSEDLMDRIELMAEGVTNVNENLGRTNQSLSGKISDTENNLSAMIRVSYINLRKRMDDLDRRVKELEKTATY